MDSSISFDVVFTSGDWQKGQETGTETTALGTSRSAVGSSGSLNARYPDLMMLQCDVNRSDDRNETPVRTDTRTGARDAALMRERPNETPIRKTQESSAFTFYSISRCLVV